MDDPPTEIDPYKTLGLLEAASADEIKTAYRKAALRWHPDKASDKETAHIKFQEIAFAYAVLSDERRRKRYDSSGRTEEVLGDDDFDWATFFRTQFAEVVTVDAIKSFSETYKGSDEEKDDLYRVYTAAKGNMTKVFSDVMLSDPCVDDDRFRDLIRQGIAAGEIEAYDKFTNESDKSIQSRIRRAKAQAKEADEHAKELGLRAGGNKRKGKDDGMAGLAALIGQRQVARAKQFDDKFGLVDEPPEEMFAANRRKGKPMAGTDAENEPNAEPSRTQGTTKRKAQKNDKTPLRSKRTKK